MPYPESQYPSVIRGYDKRESQRMLAAAPALLEALQCMMHFNEFGDLCYCEDCDPETADYPCCFCRARKAIAKAEGRVS